MIENRLEGLNSDVILSREDSRIEGSTGLPPLDSVIRTGKGIQLFQKMQLVDNRFFTL
jgi:hypothetical protein